MLTRPGSTPGSGWMRDLSVRLSSGPADTRPVPSSFWVLYIFLMILFVVVLPMVLRRAMPTYEFRFYQSSAHIAGVPLVASGAAPVAIVAFGGRPRGVIAIGGIAFGVIAVGGVAVGGLAIGGISLGIFALAGLAIGWQAAGGGALGYRAFGGFAAGSYAYAGNGVAYGYHEACGRQKERLFG